MSENKGLKTNTYRKESTDEMIVEVQKEFNYSNYYYKRLTIVPKTVDSANEGKPKKEKLVFYDIKFQYCTFDSCYIRDCKFEKCDFTGCKFINSNLSGSSFIDCDFKYAQFEKTMVDNDILNTDFHQYSDAENLKWKFARTLRLNYQQLGDTASVNKAIRVELNATKLHLKHIWSSQKSYYKNKYNKFNERMIGFIKWLVFCILDFVWGNGESIWKLVRTTMLFLLSISIINTLNYGNPDSITSYVSHFINSIPLFFGVAKNSECNELYLSIITLVRLVLFGLFMSVLIKRFNRR